ncbi:hypothetical protein V1264_007798 [Littorina saxatilis]|uniref:Uncharacterized protein n=1 Tax=Littorina saxatilis TaxID=31220 RepID=A0AAN9AVN6_9CAEN
MDYRIFSVRTWSCACVYTRGCSDTEESLHTKLTLRNKSLAERGDELTLTAANKSSALPTELHPRLLTRGDNRKSYANLSVSAFNKNAVQWNPPFGDPGSSGGRALDL